MKANINYADVKISELKEAPYNPRQISSEARNGLKASMERYGYIQPIVWNKRTGYIVSGHQRVSILKEEGVKSVSVVVVDLDEDEEKALNITQNNEYITGHWDNDKLDELLAGLKGQELYDELNFKFLSVEYAVNLHEEAMRKAKSEQALIKSMIKVRCPPERADELKERIIELCRIMQIDGAEVE